ncbi:hypothetical protein NL676_016695 [Syzygium grande]|nr:hypothetical protein NL676_016695 [Syzygium grande]
MCHPSPSTRRAPGTALREAGHGGTGSGPHLSFAFSKKTNHLKVLLSVLGCPLFPVSVHQKTPVNEVPSSAQYIVQHFTATTGCRKLDGRVKNIFATGKVAMAMAKEVVVASDGRMAWWHTPWLGAHAAKGSVRPLGRALQACKLKTTLLNTRTKNEEGKWRMPRSAWRVVLGLLWPPSKTGSGFASAALLRLASLSSSTSAGSRGAHSPARPGPPPIRVGLTESAGRGVYAARRIGSGELIHTAEPVVSHPSLHSLHAVCYSCLSKVNSSRSPARAASFRSDDCRARSQVVAA